MGLIKPRMSLDLRTEIFLHIITLLFNYTDSQLDDLAEEAGCTKQTLYNWKTGRVCFPQLHKIVAVAHAMGYELTLQPRPRRRTHLRRIK
jgi:DNA-binding phage protein